jgi:hypothetical protein
MLRLLVIIEHVNFFIREGLIPKDEKDTPEEVGMMSDVH